MLRRKVQNESATGSVSVNKVRTTLTIQVETIDFDTQGCVLRVKGRNIQENQYVKVSIVVLLTAQLYKVYVITLNQRCREFARRLHLYNSDSKN